jgi:nucleotide-binding universal stress UspA family protein
MTETPEAVLLTGPEQDQRVLVAIDFSEDSKAALLWACNFAECSSAPLILLHVVHDLASNPGFYHPEKSDHLESMQDVAESMMAEFLTRLKTEHPELCSIDEADLRFIPGLPPTRIVEVAGLLNSRLIVIGGRGLTSPPDKRLGSVAQRVVDLSMIPVVVIKSEAHGVLKKKERKRLEKRQKKDWKKLKDLLGISNKSESADSVDG